MYRIVGVLFVSLFVLSSAAAQGQTHVAVAVPCSAAGGFCIRYDEAIPLTHFATAANLTTQTSALSVQIAALESALNGRIDAALATITTATSQIVTLTTEE